MKISIIIVLFIASIAAATSRNLRHKRHRRLVSQGPLGTQCAEFTSELPPRMIQGNWTVAYGKVNNTTTDLSRITNIRLTFESGFMHGYSLCNYYETCIDANITALVDADSLSLIASGPFSFVPSLQNGTGIVMTRAECMDERDDQQEWLYLSSLPNVESFVYTGDDLPDEHLVLSGPDVFWLFERDEGTM